MTEYVTLIWSTLNTTYRDSGCLAGLEITRPSLTAATRVQYPASKCEMIMWSPSQTGEFAPGTPVSSHTKTTERKHRCQRA